MNKARALVIFRCVSDDSYFAARAATLPPATRELVQFMRACGSCSSWAWHGDSAAAYEIARLLVQVSAAETIAPESRRRAA